ncbi:MAG: Hpt domain-containing protein [Hyphomicrobium sp.]
MLMNVIESDSSVGAIGCDSLQVSPVDLKHLRRYTLGDYALEKEILELFLGQLPQTIKALSDAATDHDWRVAAHTLKGSGRAVGAWRVARLAELAERQFNVKNRTSCAQTVARIEEAAAEARTFIEATYAADPD